jgi:uncharacterized protein YdeI (BOF family)
MILFRISLVCLLVSVGCHRQPSGKVLGKPPLGDLKTVLAVRAGDTPSLVTLTGAMVEKCPEAGCWFRLQDRTGVIRVSTKSAGFVVVNIPLESQLTVAGRIVTQGDEIEIEATGLRY